MNKVGKSAIMIRACIGSNRVSLGTTGIDVNPKLWDKDLQMLKGRTTEILQTNHRLESIRAELQNIADRLKLENILTLDRVKAAFHGENEDFNTVGKLFTKYINNVKEQVGIGVSDTTYSKYSL